MLTTRPRSASAESLSARLDDPRTAAALHDLLDNAEMLALLASMVDGLIRRGEELTGNLYHGLPELRGATAGAGAGSGVRATVGDIQGLVPAVKSALPTRQALLNSQLVPALSIEALDTLSGALVERFAETHAPARKPGVRTLLADLRDPETFRGSTTLLGVARALGLRQKA